MAINTHWRTRPSSDPSTPINPGDEVILQFEGAWLHDVKVRVERCMETQVVGEVLAIFDSETRTQVHSLQNAPVKPGSSVTFHPSNVIRRWG